MPTQLIKLLHSILTLQWVGLTGCSVKWFIVAEFACMYMYLPGFNQNLPSHGISSNNAEYHTKCSISGHTQSSDNIGVSCCGHQGFFRRWGAKITCPPWLYTYIHWLYTSLRTHQLLIPPQYCSLLIYTQICIQCTSLHVLHTHTCSISMCVLSTWRSQNASKTVEWYPLMVWGRDWLRLDNCHLPPLP